VGPTGLADINFRIFSPTGVLIRDETPVHAATAKHEYAPSVTPLAGGGFAVAWTHELTLDDTDVYLRTFNAQGQAVSGEIPVASNLSLEEDAVVTGLSNDTVVVVWSEETSDGSNVFDLKGAIYSASGGLVRSEFSIDTTLRARPRSRRSGASVVGRGTLKRRLNHR
jgi:hypothetical protein